MMASIRLTPEGRGRLVVELITFIVNAVATFQWKTCLPYFALSNPNTATLSLVPT